MADLKISQLTEVLAPNASDPVAVVNASTTKKTQIKNLVNANPAIWARVFHNANQTIANSTSTPLAFNSERADADTIHDPATNNSRLTCKTAGVYLITAHIEWAANATGYRQLEIRINGSVEIGHQVVNAVAGGVVTRQALASVYALAVNDYVELVVSQNSGGSVNVVSGANYSPEFTIVRLGA